MNTRQENTLTMWNVVNNYLTSTNATWSSLPAFANAVTRFRNKLNATASYLSTQSSMTSGVTTDKMNAMKLAIEQAIIISASVQAYARDNNNNTLYKDLGFSRSGLARLSDTDLVVKLKFIHAQATANLASLSDYGITAAKLTAYMTLITNFSSQLTAPRSRQILIKTATKDLGTLFREGRNELNTMDKLINQFIASGGDFVSNYYNARQLINLGTQHTRVKVIVVDEINHTPVAAAHIRFSGHNEDYLANSDGEYKNRLAAGVYTIRCTAQGYKEKVLADVHIKAGRINVLLLTLLPL